MVFIGPDDILVGTKTGRIVRIKNSELQTTPVLDLDISWNWSEWGCLGMAIDPQFTEPGHNHIYICTVDSEYKITQYEWTDSVLTNGRVIFSTEGSALHAGGVITFGPPNVPPAGQKLFGVIGDRQSSGKLTNYENAYGLTDAGTIFRINKDGSIPSGSDKGPFYDVADGNPYLQQTYAYGIRNSFGLAFDPVSGALWDTENGPDRYDEINRMDPGTNSGWADRMGIIKRPDSLMFTDAGLMTTFGKPSVGKYSDPEFTWHNITVPTAIQFLNTDALGASHKNSCIVAAGDILYQFQLKPKRDKFVLKRGLKDRVYDQHKRKDSMVSHYFAFIEMPIDLEIGPDGNLYVLSFLDGTVYRIRQQ